LQQREQVTAAEVARELEVSERTPAATSTRWAWPGLPAGPGRRLAPRGRARTDLSGLTAGEARALFLVAHKNRGTPVAVGSEIIVRPVAGAARPR
jgi:hypothetical protein